MNLELGFARVFCITGAVIFAQAAAANTFQAFKEVCV
jgi:hypothetical protein